MLKECTVSELPALMTENPNAVFYRVSRRPLKIKGMKSAATSLAPSKYLFTDYRAGRCDWEQYIARYKKQIKESRSAQRMLNSYPLQIQG
jgi:hypothetical protein